MPKNCIGQIVSLSDNTKLLGYVHKTEQGYEVEMVGKKEPETVKDKITKALEEKKRINGDRNYKDDSIPIVEFEKFGKLEKVNEALNELLEEGVIYEPIAGMVRLI